MPDATFKISTSKIEKANLVGKNGNVMIQIYTFSLYRCGTNTLSYVLWWCTIKSHLNVIYHYPLLNERSRSS